MSQIFVSFPISMMYLGLIRFSWNIRSTSISKILGCKVLAVTECAALSCAHSNGEAAQ